MSHFDIVDTVPDDPILSLGPLFKADPRPNKINLGIGTYFDAAGKPYVLRSVRSAESALIKEELDKEYQPIDGTAPFQEAVARLIFGDELLAEIKSKLYVAQTLGASGALRTGAEFLTQENSKLLFFSNPSWPNHRTIMEKAGFKISAYPYYNRETGKINFADIKAALELIPPGSVLLMQGSCHNPSGADPLLNEWKEIALLVKQQQIIPFFDLAYQGLGMGLAEDASAIRLFAREGIELLVANSFSKNFGLYGERVGALLMVCAHEKNLAPVKSTIRKLIRSNYSNPPLHGGRIVGKILNEPARKKEWEIELGEMRARIREMRVLFHEKMSAAGYGERTLPIPEQNGFFCFCGLTTAEVLKLRQDRAIYIPEDGRLNIAGFTHHNIDAIVLALSEVYQQRP